MSQSSHQAVRRNLRGLVFRFRLELAWSNVYMLPGGWRGLKALGNLRARGSETLVLDPLLAYFLQGGARKKSL